MPDSVSHGNPEHPGPQHEALPTSVPQGADSQDWVLHVDLDQFIAAVEVLRHPELRGRPVVVGGDGDPAKRGVVSTASYEAREHGVHSGLALRTAARRCPDAVFLPVDRERLRGRVSGGHGPSLRRDTGWTTEVHGLGRGVPGRASRRPGAGGPGYRRPYPGRDRPATPRSASARTSCRPSWPPASASRTGVFRLTSQNWFEVLGDRPTDALWGIGAKTARRLAVLGIGTVRELAAADPAALAAEFGPATGPWLILLARGLATPRWPATPYLARSRGREVTYQQNIGDWAEVRDRGDSGWPTRWPRTSPSEQRPAVRVVVKVRYAPFIPDASAVAAAGPTADPAAIERAALAALDRFTRRRPVRLLGVRAEFD